VFLQRLDQTRLQESRVQTGTIHGVQVKVTIRPIERLYSGQMKVFSLSMANC
jgi:hypothetical protein